MWSLVRWWKIMMKIFGFFRGNFIFLHVSHQVRGLWELLLRIWFCFQQNPNLTFHFWFDVKKLWSKYWIFFPTMCLYFSHQWYPPLILYPAPLSQYSLITIILSNYLWFSPYHGSLRERNDHEPFILTSKIDLVLQHVHTALVFPVSQCVEKGCNSAYYWV